MKNNVNYVIIGYIPEVLDGRSKILEISLGLFCSILYMAFSALLFIYMTKSIIIPPFDNLPSLVTQTTYNVISLEGSMADIAFKVLIKLNTNYMYNVLINVTY